ncbi:hypothetical protein M885DRAFT_510940 [Pelagophyceae sp. CCMP2097]|nr:hypothetical protein M885DRAFT_510940 [Pelagophyceae sp. CCMP2097]
MGRAALIAWALLCGVAHGLQASRRALRSPASSLQGPRLTLGLAGDSRVALRAAPGAVAAFAAPGAVSVFRAAQRCLPVEAVFALACLAPLPSPLPTLRRWLGFPQVEAAPQPKSRLAIAYSLALLCYAVRDVALGAKAGLIFAGLHLAARPARGGDAAAAPSGDAAPRRLLALQVAASLALAKAIEASTPYRPAAVALLGAAKTAVVAALGALDSAVESKLRLKQANGSHLFRLVWGIALTLTANYWITQVSKNEAPKGAQEPPGAPAEPDDGPADAGPVER